MSDDCNHGHTSYSEESYFYKETKRLINDLRRMASAMAAQPAPRLVPVHIVTTRAA